MKEKGKSTNSLMKHIRNDHGINIGIGHSRDKRDLLNMGYFHSYKAYRFVKKINNPLDIQEFSEIRDIYDLDNDLKELLYPAVMKIETATKNYTIDCVVSGGPTDLQSIYETKANHYRDFEPGTPEHRREIKSFLELKKNIDGIIARNYTKSDIIQHYVHENQPVPVWAVFELTTLGDLGYFIGRLNNDTREILSKNIGIYDRRYDTANKIISKHLYIIKDLRNAIAHNNPIFDCRFKTGKVDKVVIKHLEGNTGASNINFNTITDYVLLVAYYMRCFQFTRTEIKAFLRGYERIISQYQEKANNSKNYRMIFDVDSTSKMRKFRF
ncbi:Abi family protein [Streptococcaceae bacterium ESL0687]|nr:Abi family protein [Streptococcaceae bacterium ESL0687]